MKKIIILFLSSLFLCTSYGQEKENKKKPDKPQDKALQAGISINGSLDWYQPAKSAFGKNGQDATFGFGVNLNYMFTKNIGISTGINFDWNWYHVQFHDSTFYRHNTDKVLRKKDDNSSAPGFMVKERVYKPVSLSIPTMLIFKTDLIGYFKYYGKFGLRTSFTLTQSAKDKGFEFDNGLTQQTNPDEVTIDKIKTPNDLLWIRTAVGVGGGFEYFFTSSNAFYAEIKFFYGFTNLHYGEQIRNDKQRNMHLINTNNEYFALKSNLNQLFLTVGILF